jgi:hypothetical protein
MPAAIPPITGVRAPSVKGRIDPNGSIRSFRLFAKFTKIVASLQMLRRGLVLDLSTAFGEL